jgi:hypothetical protein
MVLKEMSESAIKSYGTNIINKKRGKLWLAILVISLVWFFVALQMFNGNTIGGAIIIMTPIIVCMCAYFYSANKTGTMLWNKVKNMEQPIKLDEILKGK